LNHLSMNLGVFDRNHGPVRNTNYPIYSDDLFKWYKNKNVKSVRLMFTWEAVQRRLEGPITTVNEPPRESPPSVNYINYWADLAGRQMPERLPNGTLLPSSVLKRLLDNDISVILCPWQHNKNAGFGEIKGDTDIVYDNVAFTSDQFKDFWRKFATAINGVTGNDQRVAFDLINEPHTHAESGNKPGDIGISLADWFTYAQAAINAIRAAGATNTIFVPGIAFTAARTFTTNGSSTEWLKLTDPQKNIAVTVHCYDGITNLNGVKSTKPTTVLREACSALVTWARTNDIKVNIGEIALDAGANGRPGFCSISSLSTAKAQWNDWNLFCVANDDVLVGWNWWGNSTAGWWDQGDSCGGSHWGLTLDDGATQTIYMDLIEATLGVPIL
jgi:hypothetical protein